MMQSLWKTVGQVLLKLKMDLPYNPALALRHFSQKKKKNLFSHRNLYKRFTEALFVIAKD